MLRRLRARAILISVLTASLLGWSAGCSSGQRSTVGVRAPTSTTSGSTVPATPASSPASSSTAGTAPVPTTAFSPGGPPVQNIVFTQSIGDELLRAFAAAKGIDPSDVSGPIPGSVHYSVVTATGVYWATAGFTPSPEASLPAQVNFQDGGGTAVFSRQGESPWSVNPGHIPWPCPSDLPVIVLNAWALSYNEACVLTAPSPSQLAGLLVPTSDVPPGFVDQGSTSSPGFDTSAGPSLAKTTQRWIRTRSPADQDYISVFLDLFSTASAAISYNAIFAKETESNGPVLQQATVPGVPGATATLNAGQKPGGQGSAAQGVPPSAAACFTVAGVSVCLLVSDRVESPLPIAEQLAAAQYKRIEDAVSASSAG